MPWIDPVKEANGIKLLAEARVQSITQAIAERGGRMQDVFEEIARERFLAADLGFSLDAAAAAPAEPSPDPEDEKTPPRQRAARARAPHTGDNA